MSILVSTIRKNELRGYASALVSVDKGLEAAADPCYDFWKIVAKKLEKKMARRSGHRILLKN
jgi:hypothetical protein